jgi:hypothetical protein
MNKQFYLSLHQARDLEAANLTGVPSALSKHTSLLLLTFLLLGVAALAGPLAFLLFGADVALEVPVALSLHQARDLEAANLTEVPSAFWKHTSLRDPVGDEALLVTGVPVLLAVFLVAVGLGLGICNGGGALVITLCTT